MQPAATNREPLATAAWIAAGVVVFWSFGYTIMRGSDLWWHIAGGDWMLANRTIFVREPFAFTAVGQWWLNDAWLSDVIFSAWVAAFGMESLAYWKWLVMVVTWLVLFRVATRVSGDRTAAFAATTFGLAVAEPFLDIRPQLYSFLGFALLLDLCVGRRPPLWLPLVFLIWANLHAGFVLGLAALPLLLAPIYLDNPRQRRYLGAVFAACVALCALNPNGLEVIVRPLRYAFDTTSPFRRLGEWRPPFEPGGIQSWLYPYAIGAFAIAVAVGGGLQLQRGRKGAATWLSVVAVAGLTLFLSLRSRRIVPFFAIAQTLVLAGVLAPAWAPVARRIPVLLPPLVALVLGLYWLLPYPQRTYAFDYLTASYEFPVETTNYIEHNRLGGRVFNYYNWGGYLNLRTGGRMQVFIDGRADTVFTDANFQDYLKVLHGQPGWRDVVDASAAEWFLWPTDSGSTVQSLLADGTWELIYQDYKSALLRRKDAPPLPALKPTPDSAYGRLRTGWAAFHARNYKGAERDFLRALEMMPHLPHACWNLALVQAFTGRSAEAYATIDACGALFPRSGRRDWIEGIVASQTGQRRP